MSSLYLCLFICLSFFVIFVYQIRLVCLCFSKPLPHDCLHLYVLLTLFVLRTYCTLSFSSSLSLSICLSLSLLSIYMLPMLPTLSLKFSVFVYVRSSDFYMTVFPYVFIYYSFYLSLMISHSYSLTLSMSLLSDCLPISLCLCLSILSIYIFCLVYL